MILNTRVLFALFFLLNVPRLVSDPLDSLKKTLKRNDLHDTTRCFILNQIVNEEFDDNVWPLFNDDLIRLCQNRLKGKEKAANREDTVLFTFYGVALGNKGLVFHYKSDYAQAVNYYHQSLDFSKRVSDKSNIANIYNNLGGIYSDQRQFKTAIENFNRSLGMCESIGDSDGESQAYTNMGACYKDLDDTTKAKECFLKALVLVTGKNLNREALIYNNLGTLYREVGYLKEAGNYFQKSLALNKKIGNLRGVAVALSNVSTLLIYQKQFKAAKAPALEGLQIANELGFPPQIQAQALNLFNIEKALGDHQSALNYYMLWVKMRDSINSVESARSAMKEQLRFEFEKRKAVDDLAYENAMVLSEEREQKQKIFSLSVGIGLLLMLIFAIIIYKRLKITKRQNAVIEQQKKEVTEKSNIIEEKQKEIIDSINYAKRIQYALLAHDDVLQKHLPDHFLYFQPKDIVSGDFYWATHVSGAGQPNSNNNLLPITSNYFYLAVCDSTGHGVPGAFMSLLNISFLNEAINEKKLLQPHSILNYVRERLITELSKEGAQDGMDAILLCMREDVSADGSSKKYLSYAAANNAPLLVRNQEIIELPKDKMPVGKGEVLRDFTLHELSVEPGDMLCLYTDGFADQFGGPSGKKYKYKPLNNLLAKVSELDTLTQRKVLAQTFEDWRGELEQVDDVCMFGIRL
jgi:tetratricopeptide (TPR) repeat protein